MEDDVAAALGDATNADVIQSAANVLAKAYARFEPSAFEVVHARIVSSADDLIAELQARLSEVEYRRVESFATVPQVTPTDYGDALASADHYVERVYKIESSVFWTRLQKVVPDEFMGLVRDAKVRLDFFTAMTMFAGIYTLLWFVAMPHLVPEWTPVIWTTALGGAVTWILYRAAVESAYGFGQIFRSCFDLFRRDLLAALSINPPATLFAERDMWERLSQLIVLGQTPPDDIALKSTSPSTKSKAVFE